MKTSLRVLLFCVAATLATGVEVNSREESLFIFDSRKLTIEVPDGFVYQTGRDNGGMTTINLMDAKEKVSGEVKFLPDPEERFMNARARKDLMNEMFSDYVGSSKEKAMQFEELEPRVGAGTYCVFTDAKLVGKTPLPPGEYLHLTVGIKAWPGVVAVIRFFSNDTASPEYQAVLKLLRESVQEKPVPLK